MRTVFACVVALAAVAAAASADSLTVKITNVSDKGGMLRVGAFDHNSFAPGSTPLALRIVPAKPGQMTVTLEDVPAGEICIKVLQDLNGNGKMDFTMGIFPAEPYGFSNNPEIKMGPPSWDDVKFTKKPGDSAIAITLK